MTEIPVISVVSTPAQSSPYGTQTTRFSLATDRARPHQFIPVESYSNWWMLWTGQLNTNMSAAIHPLLCCPSIPSMEPAVHFLGASLVCSTHSYQLNIWVPVLHVKPPNFCPLGVGCSSTPQLAGWLSVYLPLSSIHQRLNTANQQKPHKFF